MKFSHGLVSADINRILPQLATAADRIEESPLQVLRFPQVVQMECFQAFWLSAALL